MIIYFFYFLSYTYKHFCLSQFKVDIYLHSWRRKQLSTVQQLFDFVHDVQRVLHG